MIRTGPILTERLLLRRFFVEDAVAAYETWMSDSEVTHFLTWNAHGSSDESRKTIGMWTKEYDIGSLDWCITLRSTGEPIGSITAVRDHPDQGWCELGYCIGQDYWDKGYMTEAVRAVTEYIFINFGYNFIQARHETENEASGRVLEKSNFVETEKRVMHNPKTGLPTEYRIMRRYCPNHFRRMSWN